jgi:Na+-driven multidrug efflux pump
MKRAGGIFLPVIPNPRRVFVKFWRQIAFIGLPVTISSGSVALGFGWLNRILAGFGSYAVVALMMSLRIEDLSFNVITGVCTALTPVLAFNYGRRDLPRMIEGMKAACKIASVTIFVVGTVIFVFPRFFTDLFRPTELAAQLAVISMRCTILSYPFILAQFVMNSLFVGTGYSIFGTVTQIVRSILIRVPAAYLFAHFLGARGIWLFQPVSWIFAAAVSWIFAVRLIRRMKNDLLLDIG